MGRAWGSLLFVRVLLLVDLEHNSFVGVPRSQVVAIFPLDGIDELLTQILDLVLAHFGLFVRELGPDLNSEVSRVVATFVEQTHTCKHVDVHEVSADHIENQSVPEGLDQFKAGCLKVNSELATLLVDGVFPLRLNVKLEQTQPVDSLFLVVVVNVMHGAGQLLLIEEKVVDLSVRNVDPGLGKTDCVIKPRDFFHRLLPRLILLGLIMLPNNPLIC